MVLVFCCCVTNDHILGGFKQHPFIISRFRGSGVRKGSAGFSVSCLPRLKPRCQLGWSLIAGPGEETASRVIQYWQSPALCGYRAESHFPHRPLATLWSLHRVPVVFKASDDTLKLFHPWNLFDLPFCYQLEKTLSF